MGGHSQGTGSVRHWQERAVPSGAVGSPGWRVSTQPEILCRTVAGDPPRSGLRRQEIRAPLRIMVQVPYQPLSPRPAPCQDFTLESPVSTGRADGSCLSIQHLLLQSIPPLRRAQSPSTWLRMNSEVRSFHPEP